MSGSDLVPATHAGANIAFAFISRHSILSIVERQGWQEQSKAGSVADVYFAGILSFFFCIPSNCCIFDKQSITG